MSTFMVGCIVYGLIILVFGICIWAAFIDPEVETAQTVSKWEFFDRHKGRWIEVSPCAAATLASWGYKVRLA